MGYRRVLKENLVVSNTRVVNRLHSAFDVDISRAGPWGNPFHLAAGASDEARGDVISRFDRWLRTSPVPRARYMRENIRQLDGKVLGCYCKSKACHGDVLVRYLNEVLGNGA